MAEIGAAQSSLIAPFPKSSSDTKGASRKVQIGGRIQKPSMRLPTTDSNAQSCDSREDLKLQHKQRDERETEGGGRRRSLTPSAPKKTDEINGKFGALTSPNRSFMEYSEDFRTRQVEKKANSARASAKRATEEYDFVTSHNGSASEQTHNYNVDPTCLTSDEGREAYKVWASVREQMSPWTKKAEGWIDELESHAHEAAQAYVADFTEDFNKRISRLLVASDELATAIEQAEAHAQKISAVRTFFGQSSHSFHQTVRPSPQVETKLLMTEKEQFDGNVRV